MERMMDKKQTEKEKDVDWAKKIIACKSLGGPVSSKAVKSALRTLKTAKIIDSVNAEEKVIKTG